MHHNPVRGELSQRLGLKQADRLVAQLAETGAEIVLCGHDHQEAVHHLESRGGLVVATAGTLCDRSRGGRPGSMNVVEFGADVIEVAAWVWDGARFVPTAARTIARRAVAERSGASVVIGR
jgi:predicted phosphodiesterase